MGISIDDVGKTVVCPKCGKEGTVAIDTFVSKGKRYRYLIVRHDRTKKCIIQRLAPKPIEDAAPKPREGRQNLTQPMTPKPEEPAPKPEGVPKPYQNRFGDTKTAPKLGEEKPCEEALDLVYALFEYYKAQDRFRAFLRGEE